MGFLGDLADQLGSQFAIGENKNHSIDSVVDGQHVNYGSLGDFASKFDQSAQRNYLEEGYLRKDPSNVDSKQFEILMQQPSATVLVKKRMFSSVGDNYRPDFMDQDEKIYYKAMAFLFQNKCKQIAALERLSKIQKISSALGSVDDQMMSILFTATADAGLADPAAQSEAFGASGGSSNTETGSFSKTIDRIRRIYAFNKSSDVTSWITDDTNIFKTQLGAGTGVIELTNFTNISTTTTTNIRSPGSFSISISDPYEAMVISDYDIERAIADATNVFNNHSLYSVFGTKTADQVVADLTSRLNALRQSRNASPISFQLSPNTMLGRRITAIIDRLGLEIKFEFDYFASIVGNGTDVDPQFLKGGDVAGYDGLDDKPKNLGEIKKAFPDSELSLFQQLVAALYNKMSMETNARNSLQQTNSKTNYARRKLRFNFLGKLILQPMDSVHVYMNSRSKYDSKLLGGLKDMFSGVNVLQSIGNAFTDVKKQWDSLFNPESLSVAAEKSAFVGAEFPSFLWNMVRPQFVNEKEGVHVFGGVITAASGNWSDGKFTVTARGSDNSYYFTLGKINDKPGSDAWSGAIYDPLTPFQTKFDQVSSNYGNDLPPLLPENQIILGAKNANDGPLLKFKAGPLAGRLATKTNYIQDKTVDPVTKQLTRTFYAPDGLVYKWKQGIGAFVQFGSSFDLNSPARVGVPKITNDPFAGQDIMNVISLLITGHPYNFANYWKAVSNFDGFANDPHSRQNAAHSYSLGITNELKKRNALWGNFIPFKTLVMDEETYAKSLQSLFRIQSTNSLLEDKLKQLEQLETKVSALGLHAFSNDAIVKIKQGLNPELMDQTNTVTNKLKKEINDLIATLNKEDTKYIVQNGDDVSFDFDEFLYSGNNNSKLGDAAARRMLRRQVNYLTRRMSYNVRGNEDKNLFIVEDLYDKDYDIAAFNSGLENLQLYSNSNLNILEKIGAAADLLNLEVFCDTQGHIRARPPQYNRMPSSIFSKMMYQKKALGIQVFPEFLNDLFSTQLTTLKNKLEVVEDEIRLDCAILGKVSDTDAASLINGSDSVSGSAVPFGFISSEEGLITDIPSLQKAAIPDENGEEFIKIQNQATNTKDVFSNAQRFTFIKDKLDKASENSKSNPTNPYNIINSVDFDNNEKINALISRIETKSGQKVKNFMKDPVPPHTFKNNPGSVDIFKVTKDLASKISERQKVIKLFYAALKNSQEFKSLDDDPSTANKLLIFGTYGNQNIPEVFEHMIEDESYDDLGPGSGQRYIIKNAQIKQYDIHEETPPYTYVEVQGVLNQFAPQGLPTELNGTFPQGGNGMTTGAAIDYDLWRTYGYKPAGPINVPFLSDPISQCAPYAVTMLSRARKEILKGSITITGNEYMQPGEVVFIENRGLLFYVKQVTQTYSPGGSWSTSLTLEYGHPPGDYIPTTLDVIGKALFNNKDIANYQIHRQSSSFNEAGYGPIIKDPNATSITANKDGGGGNYGPANATVINNIAFNASYLVYSSSTQGSNVKASIELRVYYDGKLGLANEDLKSFANDVKNILTGGVVANQPNSKNENKKSITIPEDAIHIIEVDMSSETDSRSPSQKALNAARDLIKITSANTTSTTPVPDPLPADEEGDPSATVNVSPNIVKQERDKLRKALFGNVVDCWVKLEVSPPTETTGS